MKQALVQEEPVKIDESNLVEVIDTLGARASIELVEKQYTKLTNPIIEEDKKKAYKQGYNTAKYELQRANKLGIAAIILSSTLLACLVIWCISWPFSNGAKLRQQRLLACSSGISERCQQAILDEDNDPAQRALYKSVYKQKTGQELPTVVEGWSISTTNEGGITMQKDKLRVRIITDIDKERN